MMPWRGRGGFGGFRGGGGGPRFGGGGGNWPMDNRNMGSNSGGFQFGGQGPSDRFGESSGGMFGGPQRFGNNRGRGGFKRQNNRDFPRQFNNRDWDRDNSESFHQQPHSKKWESRHGQGDIKSEFDGGARGKVEEEENIKISQDEPDYDESLCILDWYNSDLNCSITPTDFCSVTAMSSRGFGYMWAGARATHGVTRGRVCFEVRIDGNQNVSHLENETAPHVLRCGWSLNGSDLQLGEVKNSFGYGGTGKISDNCKFQSYGKTFGVGDVIGCYLDMNTDPVIMKFTVNGVDQGVAFRVSKSELNGEALFPHILTKNQDYTVNFGQLPGPMFPLLKGFTPIGQLDTPDGLTRGHRRPPSREDCEVLMMIGLPGAGKTYWAEQQKRNNPDKNYNILGTNNLIDKMRVDGLSRKRNYHGRWEELIRLCTECFNKLLELAASRRRNYILDQTNVFPTARGKKMKPFSGFQCKAIVVVPSDDEFRRRVQVREAKDGKEVPDAAVLNMKANFVLPDFEETFFSGVFYTELSPEDTHAIVIQYNAEAISLGQNPTSAVSSFKARNERQRAQAGVGVPGELLDLSADNSLAFTAGLRSEDGGEAEAGPSRPRKRSRSTESGGRVKRRNNSPGQDRSDRRRSRSRERKSRQRSRSRSREKRKDSRRRSRSRDRGRERRPRPEFRPDVDLKWQTQVQGLNQQMPSPWLSGGPGSSSTDGNSAGDFRQNINPFTNNFGGADAPMQGLNQTSLPNFGIMNERELATFVSSNPTFLANLGPNFQNCFNMAESNNDSQDNPRKSLLGAPPPENTTFKTNKFHNKGNNNFGSSSGYDPDQFREEDRSHNRNDGVRGTHNMSQNNQQTNTNHQHFNSHFGNPRGRNPQESNSGGGNRNIDFSKPPPGFGGAGAGGAVGGGPSGSSGMSGGGRGGRGGRQTNTPSFSATSQQNSSFGGKLGGFTNDPNPFMIPGTMIQGQNQRQGSQYNQSNIQQNPPPSQRTNHHQQDFQAQNRRFGEQSQGFNNPSNFQHQPDHRPTRPSQNHFNQNQGGHSGNVPQSHFNRGPPAESQNSFNSRFNPPDRSSAGQNDYRTGRGASNSSFGGEMFQRRERDNQPTMNQRPSYESSGELSGAGRGSQWSSEEGAEYQDEGRQNRHFSSQSAGRDSYSSSQSRRPETGGRAGQPWNAGGGRGGKQYFEKSQSSLRPEEDSYQYESQESWPEEETPREREEAGTGHSRRSVENVKSAGDRRMERELGSGIIKNPFDPSNKIGGRQKLNRLNEEFDESCMNPEAPDPPAAASGSSKKTTDAETGKTESGAPDYAALLQYLQFYQKQMDDDKKK